MSPPASSIIPSAPSERLRAPTRAHPGPAPAPTLYISQHPRLPHAQLRPSGTTVMCPNSDGRRPNAAAEQRPVDARGRRQSPSRGSRTRPPGASRAAEAVLGHAAAFASFSTMSGEPGSRSDRASRSGSLRQARCGAKQDGGAVVGDPPGRGRSRPLRSPAGSQSASTTSTICSLDPVASCRPRWCDARSPSPVPSSSTTPAATFVPPN